MTIHVNIGEAKTRLSELVEAAKRGEEVIIARSGSPEVKLVPVEPKRDLEAIAKARREAYGSWKGKFPDDIDWTAPMSEQELAEWYGDSSAPNGVDEPAR